MTVPSSPLPGDPSPAESAASRISSHGSQAGVKLGTFCVWLGTFCILLIMAIPHLRGETYALDDLGAFHFPLRAFYADCLANGHSFDWMTSLFGGFFVSGEGQLGGYHPFHWLLYRCFPLRTAFHLELLASYPFMMLGMFLFLRHLVSRRDAAWFGAMVFTFSAFSTLHFIHPNAVAVVAHIPWLLVAIRSIVEQTGRHRLAAEIGLVLLTASQLFLGYPQYVWFSLLAESAWALFLLRGNPWPYVRLLLFKGFGLFLSVLQLLPTWEVLQGSVRSGASLEFLMTDSWHPVNLMQMLSPFLFSNRALGGYTHEFGLYVGAIPLLLVGWLLLIRHNDLPQQGFIRYLVFLLVCAGLLACGRYGGVAILQTYLPFAGNFRVPARALVLVHFILATLTAVAWSEMAKGVDTEERHQISRLGMGLTVLALMISLLFPLLLSGPDHQGLLASWPWIAIGPLLILIGTCLCQGLARGAVWALPALILFTALDLGFYGVTYAIFPTVDPAMERLLSEFPPGQPGDKLVAIPKTFGIPKQIGVGNHFIARGFGQVDGYAGLEPRNRLFEGGASISALRAAGVKWVHAIASPTHTEQLTKVNPYWWEVPRPMPRLRLVTRTVSSQQPSRDISTIDLETTVLVDSPVSLEPGIPGRATILTESPGTLLIQTITHTPQLVVLTDRFHRGWQATRDDAPTETLRVNGDFLGWVVPAGSHTTRLEFRPASLLWGWRGTCLGLFLLAVYFSASIWHLGRPSNREHLSCHEVPTPATMTSENKKEIQDHQRDDQHTV